jgi:hypothetical protein
MKSRVEFVVVVKVRQSVWRLFGKGKRDKEYEKHILGV